jgi:hypothetical protein
MAPSRGSMLATALSCDLRSEVRYRAIFIRTTYLRGMISAASVPITADWQSRNVGGAMPKTSGGEPDALDLLQRKRTHFVLWRPGSVNPPPALVIGTGWVAQGLPALVPTNASSWSERIWRCRLIFFARTASTASGTKSSSGWFGMQSWDKMTKKGPSFEWTVRKLIDCRLLGFADGSQAARFSSLPHEERGYVRRFSVQCFRSVL